MESLIKSCRSRLNPSTPFLWQRKISVITDGMLQRLNQVSWYQQLTCSTSSHANVAHLFVAQKHSDQIWVPYLMIWDSRTGSFSFFFLNLKRAANFLVTCECTVTLSKAESNQKSTFHFFTLQLCCPVMSLGAFPLVCCNQQTPVERGDSDVCSRWCSCGGKKTEKKTKDVGEVAPWQRRQVPAAGKRRSNEGGKKFKLSKSIFYRGNVSRNTGGLVRTLDCYYNVSVGPLTAFSLF